MCASWISFFDWLSSAGILATFFIGRPHVHPCPTYASISCIYLANEVTGSEVWHIFEACELGIFFQNLWKAKGMFEIREWVEWKQPYSWVLTWLRPLKQGSRRSKTAFMGKQWNSFPKQSFLMMSWRQNDLAQLNPEIDNIPVPLTSMTFLSVMCWLYGGSDNTGRNGEVTKICVSHVSRAGSLWWLLVNQNQNKNHSIGESRKIFDLILDLREEDEIREVRSLPDLTSGSWVVPF